MKKLPRTLAIVLLLLTGVNALVAGALFIADPSGGKMGLSADYLQFSPFRSFLVPGLVLFVVNGVLNVWAAVALIRKSPRSGLWTLLQGVLLGGWIVVQVLMVRDINPLHVVMFTIGALLIICGFILWRNGNSGGA